MPVPCHGSGNGESDIVQCGHESVFFEGGEPGHVQPCRGGAVTEIIAVGLYGAEGDAAKAVDFEDQFFLLLALVLALVRLALGIGTGRGGLRRENDVDV